MKVIKVISVVGARPNFMKIAPFLRAINKYNQSKVVRFKSIFIHTGQHYDYEMSKVFFKELKLPKPNIYLGVGSGTHAKQTAKIMVEFEKVLINERPELVVVVGDVNSTLACALVAAKLHIPVAHIEAGLRSFDRSMPEEINRLLTDAISEFLFTHSPDADENLKKEGISDEKIFRVGNVMVDNLLFNLEKARHSSIMKKLKLLSDYAVITLHRPSNVDHKKSLLNILNALKEISVKIPIVFPVHPRLEKQIKTFGFRDYFKSIPLSSPGIYLINPLGFLDFLNLMMNAKFVMTDSGGIQEETTVLNVPCLTLRNNTERMITVTQGTNILVGNENQKIIEEAFRIIEDGGKKGSCPELWDGKAAERIVEILGSAFG